MEHHNARAQGSGSVATPSLIVSATKRAVDRARSAADAVEVLADRVFGPYPPAPSGGIPAQPAADTLTGDLDTLHAVLERLESQIMRFQPL